MEQIEKVNVAVIGVGWFGEKHAQIYKDLAGSRLVGVYDQDNVRTHTVAKSLNVIGFNSMDDLLADRSIDAVDICIKDRYHLKPVQAACKAGKHVMLEKPMALTLVECEQIIAASKEAGVKLMVGHILRFNPQVMQAQYKIRAGEIGSVRHFYARRNLPKSAPRHVGDCYGYHSIIYDVVIHEIDLVQWLADDDIVEVYAKYQSGVMEAEGYSLSDSILTMLQFRNGAISLTEHSWIYPDNFPAAVDGRIEITGTHGRIELDFGYRDCINFTEKGAEYFGNSHWPVMDNCFSSDLRYELETFVKCVADDIPVPVTGEDSKKTIAVASAIEASLISGKAEKVSHSAIK